MLVKLPETLWFVITAGALITLIVAFDRPFIGDLGLDPEPYQLIREQLMAD